MKKKENNPNQSGKKEKYADDGKTERPNRKN